MTKISKIESIVKQLLEEKKFHEANWFLTKQMNQKQNIEYARFVANKVKSIDLRTSIKNNVDNFTFYINNFNIIDASEFAFSTYITAFATFPQTQKVIFVNSIINYAVNVIKEKAKYNVYVNSRIDSNRKGTNYD